MNLVAVVIKQNWKKKDKTCINILIMAKRYLDGDVKIQKNLLHEYHKVIDSQTGKIVGLLKFWKHMMTFWMKRNNKTFPISLLFFNIKIFWTYKS